MVPDEDLEEEVDEEYNELKSDLNKEIKARVSKVFDLSIYAQAHTAQFLVQAVKEIEKINKEKNEKEQITLTDFFNSKDYQENRVTIFKDVFRNPDSEHHAFRKYFNNKEMTDSDKDMLQHLLEGTIYPTLNELETSVKSGRNVMQSYLGVQNDAQQRIIQTGWQLYGDSLINPGSYRSGSAEDEKKRKALLDIAKEAGADYQIDELENQNTRYRMWSQIYNQNTS